MKFQIKKSHAAVAMIAAVFAYSAVAVAAGPDEEAARELARQNNCFRCHATHHAKDGPAWNKVAAKLRGDPKAEEKLIHHLTSGELAKFPDGHTEHHKIVKTDPPHDMAQIKNLVDWILSLQ